MSQTINTFHAGLFSVSFSNIPTVTNPADLQLFENFLKSCSFPEYGIELDESHMQGYRILHPIAHKQNTELNLLQLEFKVSENFQNYIYLFNWIYKLRYGVSIDPLVRKYVTDAIHISIYDNVKRTTGKFKFSKAVCVFLSAIPLAYGASDEVTMVTNWNYEQITWEPETIPECEA